MAFNIDKMKADGVSSHLIELASMDQETLLLLVARRLEHDRIFQQFMGAEVSSVEAMYPYAVAAGLMSEEDRKWLIDEENPYKPQGGDEPEVWLVGDTGEESETGMMFILSNVDAIDHATELYTNGENYNVYLNGTELPYFVRPESGVAAWSDANDQTASKMVILQADGSAVVARAFYVDASTAPESVEISVAHK